MAAWDWEDGGPTEEGTVRKIPLAEMLSTLRARLRPHSRALGIGAGLLVLSVLAELAAPLLLRRLIDQDLTAARDTGSFAGILRTAGLYLFLVAGGSLATYLQTVTSARMGLDLVRQLKQDTFDHVLTLGADYFDHNPPGRLMARVESDAERLQVLFSEVTLSLLRTGLLLFGTLGVMFSASPGVTLAVIVLITPFTLLALLFVRFMRGVYGTNRKLYARVSTFVTEYVQAVPILQVYGRSRWALAKLDERGEKRYRAESRSEFMGYGFWSLFYSVEVLAVMLILWLGFGGRFGSALTLGTVVLFVEYTRRLFFPIVMFTEQIQFIQRAFASADRVFGILRTESRVAETSDPARLVPRDWREIRFEDVSFVYEAPSEEGVDAWDDRAMAAELEESEAAAKRGKNGKDRPPEPKEGSVAPKQIRALDQVAFRIRRGERIALVGPSGGGKSTATNLLLRFYDPTAGRITLDGVDLKSYPQKAWRDRVGLVLQDIHLFPGTIADNLRVFHDEIGLAELERAVRALGAEDLIARLPKGLETPLSEGGQNLSMGERQIVSFARALVRDPDLLILDEATSSVDPVTERRIQESLERLLAGRTSLIVAHRLSTVTTADRILVLQHGRVVEEGNHEELMRRQGVYAALFDLQFRAGELV